MVPRGLMKYKPEYLAKGKRSEVYTLKISNKLYAVKVKKEDIGAKNTVENEAKFLKILNKYKIGPKFRNKGKNYIMYEFVKGEFFVDWIKKSSKKNAVKIIKNILEQCRIMDKLKINKKEFHKPIKHIIVYKNKPVMIDFERCYYAEKPKNVTQFCQFLLLINKIKPEAIGTLKEYKKNESDGNFKKILKLI